MKLVEEALLQVGVLTRQLAEVRAERDRLAEMLRRVDTVKLVRLDDGTWYLPADAVKAVLNGEEVAP